jgi:hypothetical protein
MTKEQFMDLFVRLCAAYGRKYDEPQAIVYFQYLSGYDYEIIKKAVDSAIMSPGNYMPTVGDLLSLVNPPDVGKAWEKVVRVASGGCRRWRELTDIEIATVSAIGGMNAIQDANDEGLHFIFNDFKRTFPIIVKRGVKYLSDSERLKDLNMVAETFKFLKGSSPEISEQIIPEIKPMLSSIGERI